MSNAVNSAPEGAGRRLVLETLKIVTLGAMLVLAVSGCSSGPERRRTCYSYSTYSEGTRNYGAYNQRAVQCE